MQESRLGKRHREDGALASAGQHTYLAFDVFNAVGEDIMRHIPMSSEESVQESERDVMEHVQTLLGLQTLGLVGTVQIRSHLIHHYGYSIDEFLQEEKKISVAQLKALCRGAGVSTSGIKVELLDRLKPTISIPGSLFRKVVEQVKVERFMKIKRISRRGIIDDGRHPLWMEHILKSTKSCYSIYGRYLVGKPFYLPRGIISDMTISSIFVRGVIDGRYRGVYKYRPSFVLYIASLLFDEDKMATIMESINGMKEIMDGIRAEDMMRVHLENSLPQISAMWDKEGWSGLNLLHEGSSKFARTYPHTYARLVYVQDDGEESIEKAHSLMEKAIASRRTMQELKSKHGVMGLTEACAQQVSDMIDRAISLQNIWMQRGFDDADVLDTSVVLSAFNSTCGQRYASQVYISEQAQRESGERASKLRERYSKTWKYVLEGNDGPKDNHMQARTCLHEQQHFMDAESHLRMTECIAEKLTFGRPLLDIMIQEWQQCDLPGLDFFTVENLLQYLLDRPAFLNSLPKCEESWQNGLPSKSCFLYRFGYLFNGVDQMYLKEDDIRAYTRALQRRST